MRERNKMVKTLVCFLTILILGNQIIFGTTNPFHPGINFLHSVNSALEVVCNNVDFNKDFPITV